MKKNTLALILLLFILTINSYSQKQPVSINLTDKNSFSLVIYPDPQSYTKFDVNQPIFELMTAWTAHNTNKLNIKSVLCVGDLVEQNGILVTDSINGNQTSKEQWESVSKAFEKLDNTVSYILCTGNHDYGYQSSEKRFTDFPVYFYPERNTKIQNQLVETFTNWEGYHTLENAAYQITDNNWGKMLILSLEFAPRDEVLEWASQLVNSDKYKNHTTIILTHSYMDTKGEKIEKEGYALSDTSSNYGTSIWDKLIFQNPNIRLVICGHAATAEQNFENNVSFSVNKNTENKAVYQMMFNAQTAGGGWSGNGGDGWLRLLEFLPDGKTIQVQTFSPFFAISPTTAKHAFRTESYDKFSFTIEK